MRCPRTTPSMNSPRCRRHRWHSSPASPPSSPPVVSGYGHRVHSVRFAHFAHPWFPSPSRQIRAAKGFVSSSCIPKERLAASLVRYKGGQTARLQSQKTYPEKAIFRRGIEAQNPLPTTGIWVVRISGRPVSSPAIPRFSPASFPLSSAHRSLPAPISFPARRRMNFSVSLLIKSLSLSRVATW